MTTLSELPISKLFIGASNVRKTIGDLTELKLSIEEHGVLEPLLVRPLKNKFEVVIGSRRYHAAKTLLRRVPVIIKPLSDAEALALSLVENIQRHDLELEEEAEGILKLMELDPKRFANAKTVSDVLGKSETAVRELLAAYNLAKKLREKGMKIHAVKNPSEERRKEGEAIPLKHAELVAAALESEPIQSLSKRERDSKARQIVQAVAPLLESDARRVVNRFKMFPKKSIERIKSEALADIEVNVHLTPRVARALAQAVEKSRVPQEELVRSIIEDWLVDQGFIKHEKGRKYRSAL